MFATIDDVAAELGRPTPEAESDTGRQWQQWIDRVGRSIVRAATRAGVDENDIVYADANDVTVVRVAARVTTAMPDGLTSITVTVDDGNVTRRREGGDFADPLDLTSDDLELLFPTKGERDSGSTRPGFEPDSGHLASLTPGPYLANGITW